MPVSLDSIFKLPTPQKIGILFLVSVIVLGGYWYSFQMPKLRRIEANKSKLDDLIRDRNVKNNIAKELDKFKIELRNMNEELRVSLTKLPDKNEIPNLLKNISNLGKESGLEVLLFKPQGEEVKQFYARVPVELKFIGSYHKIGMFFYHVGTLSRIVNIENFSIVSAPEKKKGEIVLAATCIATTYRYVEQPTPPEKKEKKK